MTSYLESMWVEVFTKRGEDAERAKSLAHVVVKTLDALGIVPFTSLDAFEMDARIYDLRGKHVPEGALMERLGINKRRLYRGLKNTMRKRRAAMLAMDDEPLGKVG